jgi:hypothetical protein
MWLRKLRCWITRRHEPVRIGADGIGIELTVCSRCGLVL